MNVEPCFFPLARPGRRFDFNHILTARAQTVRLSFPLRRLVSFCCAYLVLSAASLTFDLALLKAQSNQVNFTATNKNNNQDPNSPRDFLITAGLSFQPALTYSSNAPAAEQLSTSCCPLNPTTNKPTCGFLLYRVDNSTNPSTPAPVSGYKTWAIANVNNDIFAYTIGGSLTQQDQGYKTDTSDFLNSITYWLRLTGLDEAQQPTLSVPPICYKVIRVQNPETFQWVNQYLPPFYVNVDTFNIGMICPGADGGCYCTHYVTQVQAGYACPFCQTGDLGCCIAQDACTKSFSPLKAAPNFSPRTSGGQ
jgi:hypothetical protein